MLKKVGIVFTKNDKGYYIEQVSTNIERLKKEWRIEKEFTQWTEVQKELKQPTIRYNHQFLAIEKIIESSANQIGIVFTKEEDGYYIEQVSSNLESLRKSWQIAKEFTKWEEVQQELQHPTLKYRKQFLAIERLGK